MDPWSFVTTTETAVVPWSESASYLETGNIQDLLDLNISLRFIFNIIFSSSVRLLCVVRVCIRKPNVGFPTFLVALNDRCQSPFPPYHTISISECRWTRLQNRGHKVLQLLKSSVNLLVRSRQPKQIKNRSNWILFAAGDVSITVIQLTGHTGIDVISFLVCGVSCGRQSVFLLFSFRTNGELLIIKKTQRNRGAAHALSKYDSSSFLGLKRLASVLERQQ